MMVPRIPGRNRWIRFLGLFVLVAARPLHAQDDAPRRISVVGLVGDFSTGGPIVGAFVRIDGELSAITDDVGQFQMVLDPGWHRIQVRRIGYEAKDLDFHLDGAPLMQLSIALNPIPFKQPEIVVQGDRTRMVFGAHRDFYRRMREGTGYYFTRDEIERRSPRVVSDLLRIVPGLVVSQVNIDPAEVRVLSRLSGCGNPVYFLDGFEVDASSPDLLTTPAQVEAIEIYTRAINTPPEFQKRGSTCGVIAIWTR